MKKIILFLLISTGAMAQQSVTSFQKLKEFNLISNPVDQEKHYNQLLKDFPPSKPNEYDEYLASLAIGYLNEGNIEKYRQYTKTNPKFSVINIMDVVYALEKLENDDKHIKTIEEVSRGIIDLLENEKRNDGISKGRLQVLLELNAMANAKLGNKDAALNSMEKASAISGDRDAKYFRDSKSSYYDRYAIVLSSAGGEHKRALDTLTAAFRNGDTKPTMVKTFTEIYKKVHGNDKGADQLIASLQAEAYKKYYAEVEKMYIEDSQIPFVGKVDINNRSTAILNANKHAKEIALTDLKGNKVNFAGKDGKISVIDFWTTGCTPCVAAFAGFERVVADYKKEEFQLYVVNLFEDQETVKSFINKKKIPLDVLMDQENAAYDIKATPTKIVFDPMGNIRFFGIGYAGSTDKEYYKLKAMVEIVKERAAANASAQTK